MSLNAVIGALRVNLGLDTAQFDTGVENIRGSLGGISKMFAALGGVAVFAAFSAGVGDAVGRIENMRKLSAQLDQALANTGNVAKTSASEISDFADTLERKTGRAAEEVMAVSTNLATFGFGRETFFRAIELADDMAAAWGGDLKQNIEGVSRALAEPEKGLAMLTKRGITFSAEQQKMIAGFVKTGDLAGAQGVIFQTLEEQVKGVAEAGFGGLTAATANAAKALEDFFEGITNAVGVNSGLEAGLMAITAGLDLVTQNLDTVFRVAGVVGTALLTAFGPAMAATIATSASVFSMAVIGGIRAIGVAIAANPIGFLITALATAISAAFLFRDQIKQAIGIDVVGVFKVGANFVIGSFVGAFDNIKTYWANFPAVIGDLVIQAVQASINAVEGLLNNTKGLINSWIDNINGALGGIGINIATITGDVDLPDVANPWANRGGMLADEIKANNANAMSRDYIGELTTALGEMWGTADKASGSISALSSSLDGGGASGGGGAASALRGTAASADKLSTSLDDADRMGQRVSSSLSSGFADLFKGMVTGSKSASESIGALIGKLGDLFINQGFNSLFGVGSGGGGGGGNIFGSLFSGIGKLFGFKDGGSFEVGGSGGIDSQLVAFKASPNERVTVTKPGQSVGGGSGGSTNIFRIDARGAQQGVGPEIVREFRKQLPSMLRDINRRSE